MPDTDSWRGGLRLREHRHLWCARSSGPLDVREARLTCGWRQPPPGTPRASHAAADPFSLARSVSVIPAGSKR